MTAPNGCGTRIRIRGRRGEPLGTAPPSTEGGESRAAPRRRQPFLPEIRCLREQLPSQSVDSFVDRETRLPRHSTVLKRGCRLVP